MLSQAKDEIKVGSQRAAHVAGQRPDLDSFYHLREAPSSGMCCSGTACYVAKHLNPARITEAERQPTRLYCLGQCFAAPAAVGDSGHPHVEIASPQSIVLSRLVKGGARTLSRYQLFGGYQAWEMATYQQPADVVRAIELSELRGRGGAGFPAGRKWRSVFDQSASEKFIIANADEGDAGAYIDRFLLEDDPHAVIEGMLIAAYAVGASRGFVYLRSEYPTVKTVLENALAESRDAGLLGSNARGHGQSFDIEIHVGKGSYICGEETALIRSIEGQRPEAMARPPYATEKGLFGKPTVVNNVETLVNVPWIIRHGPCLYRTLGISRSRGTKVISLNSLFHRPGLYEVEFGITIRQIVEGLGGGLRDGEKVKGVIIGGPLAGILPPDLMDTPLGYEELWAVGASLGHGGVIAFDRHTSITALMHHVFSFAAFESCGKCTTCRIGTHRIQRILVDAVQNGAINPRDQQECERIITALKWSSLCGFGTGLAEFASSVFRHYGKELELCRR